MFADKFAGLIASPSKDVLSARKLPSITGGTNILFSVKKGTPIGRTTGNYFEQNGKPAYLQIELYQAQKEKYKTKFAYILHSLSSLVPVPDGNTVDVSQAQKALNTIISNDQKTFNNLAIATANLRHANSKAPGYEKLKTAINKVSTAYTVRQNYIKNSTAIKTEKSTSEFTRRIEAYYKNLFGIGEPISLISICIGLAVVTVISAAVYYGLQSHVQASMVNAKMSGDMLEAAELLNKKYPGEKKGDQMLADFNSQVKEAFKAGADSKGGPLEELKGILVVLLFGGIVYVASKKL